MTTKETVEVGRLDLDPINPRTNPEADQTAAMRSLISVERDGEKIYALAQNICQMGTLDPGDRLYTVASADDAGRYVVVDGNRRLTALRLLSQPGLLDHRMRPRMSFTTMRSGAQVRHWCGKPAMVAH